MLLDESMGSFGPQDKCFQLSGNVGFDSHLERLAEQKKSQADMILPNVPSSPIRSERQEFILTQMEEFFVSINNLFQSPH